MPLYNNALISGELSGTTNVSGGQLKFPATQSASADANTLDDYEEGTFTPVLSGTGVAGSGTYTTQVGRYIKIGKLVYVQIYFALSNHTGTGSFVGSGLPFTSVNATSANSAFTIGYVNNLTTAAGHIPISYINPNATSFELASVPTGGGAAGSIAVDTSFSLVMMGCYEAAA